MSYTGSSLVVVSPRDYALQQVYRNSEGHEHAQPVFIQTTIQYPNVLSYFNYPKGKSCVCKQTIAKLKELIEILRKYYCETEILKVFTIILVG